MFYHFNITNQLHRICKSSNLFKKSNLDFEYSEFISDIQNGKIYQDLLKSEDSEAFKTRRAFSFCINTDGIACDSIKLWPIYLTINEIPIGTRFCINNVIVAGLLVYLQLHAFLFDLNKKEYCQRFFCWKRQAKY